MFHCLLRPGEALNLRWCDIILFDPVDDRILEKNNEIFFKYHPKKNIRKNSNQKNKKESPFGILKNISFN